ncbi:MAG: glycosyltransferase, partial [Flammeovirgaceae bacterium]
FLLTIGLLVGWFLSLQVSKFSSNGPLKTFSVVVPFRNEAQHLAKLLQTLAAQSYPSAHYEVICVDDHSSDGSTLIVEEFASKNANVKLLQLPPQLIGKKRALAHGAAAAQFEIIATTDADCQVPYTWLESMAKQFTPNINLLVGAVKLQPGKDIFSKLQAMEFSSLIGSGFATLAFGKPTMANGANLAFRKAIFEQVGGYEGSWHVASGDDEHLMQKLSKQFPHSVHTMTGSESVVTTSPQASLNDFLQQRLRWAGKWKFNQSVFSKSLAVFIFLFQVTYLMSLMLFFFNDVDNRQLGLLLSVKWALEFLFLYAVHLFLRLKWNWFAFFALQIVYPIYVITVAITAFFSSTRWKGREL